MSALTKWFAKMEQETGTNTAITELFRIYETLPKSEREGDLLGALNKACRDKSDADVCRNVTRIHLNNFDTLRHCLQNRYNVLHVDMHLDPDATIGDIYGYVVEELERHARTNPDIQKLHNYCYGMSDKTEDIIYVLVGAALHANMSDVHLCRVLVNLAGVLCMQCKGNYELHPVPIRPDNYLYSELYGTGHLTFNGLDFYNMVDILDDLKISFDKISDESVCDLFSCQPHSIADSIELAEQYQSRAGLIHPISLKDARLSNHYGENRLMHLISVYAEGVTSESTLALNILYTLTVQLVLLYGKRYKVNENFYRDRKDGLSYAAISKLLLYEEE